MRFPERRAVFSLSLIMTFRLLGLFMILPIFSLYVTKIPNATPLLIGIALGIYGLTQACFQTPFGMLSDRIGRKPVITGGLILFALGSVIAAFSHSIYFIILGRAIQGAGAIGSTILATVADLTHDEDRSKAMAIIGLSVGASFIVAMVVGPALNAWIQLSGIFWVTALLALISILLLYTIIPTPKTRPHPEVEPERNYFKPVVRNVALWRLNFGIFSLDAILTALFIAIPLLLEQRIHPTTSQQILFYFVVMMLSFAAVLPTIIMAEKKRLIKPLFLTAIFLLMLCPLLLLINSLSIALVGLLLFLFFIGFTFLEASLPSWVSKISPIRQKGTAMGIYSSSQFLGIFFGGSVGGWIFGHYHQDGLFIFCGILAIIWLLVSFRMAPPPYLSTIIIQADSAQPIDSLKQHLRQLAGVAEVAFLPTENLIYVKIDKKIITEDELRNKIRAGNL